MRYYYNKNSQKRFSAGISATWLIIIATGIISILGLILFAINPDFIKWFAINPEYILSGKYLWTLFLHVFVHGGPGHLLINMIALHSLGRICERIIGRVRFLIFYIISGIFAGILAVLASGFLSFGLLEKIVGPQNAFMLGASGAIFGIAGLFVVIIPKARFSLIFFPFFSLPAWVMVPLILALTWLATIAANLSIGNVAHFGGFLSGIIYGIYLRKKYKKRVMLLDHYFR